MINLPLSDSDRLTTLRATPEFNGWSERSLRALLSQFDEVALPAGRVVAVEGRPCGQFLVVLAGELRASSDAGERRLRRAGDSVGWRAMWERGRNEASVVVDAEARLLVMGHAQFRAVKAEAGLRAA
jgi:CRP-like cAMP-binding protein